MDTVPYRLMRSVGFIPYSSDQAKKLSVLEITSLSIFDDLDHPSDGGLYDRALGPCEKNDVCGTCGLNSFHCPGHYGHINLPLPVFSPLFINILMKLLRGSCLGCHRLLAPQIAVQLALHQFEALDYGLIGTVQELEEIATDLSAGQSKGKSSSDVVPIVAQKLKEILQKAISGLDLDVARANASVKNVVECRQRIMKSFIKDHLMGAKSKCSYCGTKKKAVSLRNNCRFVLAGGQKSFSVQPRIPRIKLEKNAGEDGIDNLETLEDSSGNVDLTAKEAKEHLHALWRNDGILLGRLFGILRGGEKTHANPMDVFFTEAVIVPPVRFRPINVVRGKKLMNTKTAALKEILQDSFHLKTLLLSMKNAELTDGEKETVSKLQGKNNTEKLHILWYKLQAHVNVLLDMNMDKFNTGKYAGVKQVLEAKEGLFRGHMMGKRVNYVARSVISPDPNIMVDEIGVPEVFAKKLTYPEPVTPWNVEKLRAAVLNGPHVHPGAVAVENENGTVTLLSNEQTRLSHASFLLTPDSRSAVTMKPKKVHRHLQNGDILLLNRQPTLHKPSIMAHRARVLPGEKALRLHYANCKAYNADFDGDEMNAHFPQSEIARSEGYNIVSVNHQYLVPKDGTPLSGLIQDHIVSSTLLTMRGRFFTREQYHRLVYNAIPNLHKKIKTLPPSILKPQVLWSGKQVVSTVIINIIPEGKKPVTVEGKSKISSKIWQNAPKRNWQAGGQLTGNEMCESEVIIHSGELLCGILDKAHIGPTPYGLVHCCYELYGGKTSNLLLTSLGRLFVSYFKDLNCFSLGVEDILLTSKATRKRKKVMCKAGKVGDATTAKALDVTNVVDHQEILEKYRDAHMSKDPIGLKQLDFEMKKVTDGLNNDINNVCMPGGLEKKFPQNNLQLLVQSGAKGSTVNCMQISCLLGQIELEGRRVPLTINGNSLPSFRPYDTSPRAGGFVDGRFLTGIRPKEYYFHCMAGREGLVDTAVKTSRSGYLQRCIIKHMEGLVVNYDMTVRDSDGSVIQFLYGEDGLDVTKMQMLKPQQFPALVKNYEAVLNKEEVDLFKSRQITEDPAAYKKLISRWQRKFGKKSEDEKLRITADRSKKHRKKCPDPLTSFLRPDLTLGCVSELLDNTVEEYIKKNPHGDICDKWKPGISVNPEMFREMVHYRTLKSLAQPGEPVGLLAAQSIGEPSTQMTLNTFHFAGRGEMNVTLGIPRLREILMVASANIATPSMDLPLLNIPDVEEKAEKLRIELTAVHLKQVLEYVEVIDEIHVKSRGVCFREYRVIMKFLPPEVYKDDLYANTRKILKYIEQIFIKKVVDALRKKLSSMTGSRIVSIPSKVKSETASEVEVDSPPETPARNAGEDDTSSGEEDGEGDAVDVKSRARHDQDANYQEPEEEEEFDGASEDEDEATEETASEQAEDPENDADEPSPEKAAMDADKAARINFVKGIHGWVSNYDYDTKKRRCEFSLMLDLKNSSTDIKSLIENEISKAVVHELPRIKRAFIVREPRSKGDEKKMLKTEGVNFLEIFKYDNAIDMRRIYSNDIHAIASFLGIEAANRVIVKEVSSVFAIYGIEVDPRHLLLIADYMTFDGFYKPFNRLGLESNASPLQQMSFETTLKFFADATLTGAKDMLKSPSSKLVVGHLVGGGTGSFDVLLKPYKPNFKKMW